MQSPLKDLTIFSLSLMNSHRKSWPFTSMSKSNVIEVLKIFVALIERQSGKKVKALEMTNGGEYYSKIF
jgi:hypothetical protein